MEKDRLTAFSDGVIAIIITIMVLELRPPAEASFAALGQVAPQFFAYTLSFIYVAIYWNNHHHMMAAVERVNGAVLWANMHLLFWLSLTPFAAAWLGRERGAPVPTVMYGIALLMPAIAYLILQTVLLRLHGKDSPFARALTSDFKGTVSPLIYVTGIIAAFWFPHVAHALYALVAVMWLAPDSRFERLFKRQLAPPP